MEKLKKVMVFILIVSCMITLSDLTFFPTIKLPHYKKQNFEEFNLYEIKVVDENNDEINLFELFKPNELHFYQYSMKYLQFSEDPKQILKFISKTYNEKYSKNVRLKIKSTLIKIKS